MLKTGEQRHTIDFFKDTLKTWVHQSDKEPVGRCLVTMGHSQIRTQTRTNKKARGENTHASYISSLLSL